VVLRLEVSSVYSNQCGHLFSALCDSLHGGRLFRRICGSLFDVDRIWRFMV
jgi:hypothetical protein